MANPTAVVQSIEGEVSVVRNGETVAVQAGDILLPGDEITTGSTGRLALEFPGLEGQTPAAGVMSANGKITLGEQPGPNGQQIVVLEESECFEFTTEVAENSAAVEGSAEGLAGLFGAGLMGGGGALGAGLGAIAAGAFIGGSGGGSDGADGAVGAAGVPGSNGGLGGAAGGLIGSGDFSREDKPETPEEFVEENLTPENAQGTLFDPIQNAIEATAADPTTLPQNLQTAVGEVATGVAENLHDALLATTGEGSPQADLVNQLVAGLEGTPLGEPLSPVASQLQSLAGTEIGVDTLLSAADAGLVTTAVNLAEQLASPLVQQAEPLGEVFNQLDPVAAGVDNLIDDVVDTVADGLGGLLNNPGAEGLEGILGGADTLQAALNQATGGAGSLPETPLDGALGQVTAGISSVADALGGAGGGLPALPTDGLL